MDHSRTGHDAEADADALPKHTTPTWEVELLISGVAIFAMLQLPGWLDSAFFRLIPRFEADWGAALRIVHMYLKGAAIILAITFALHLLLRARWIALVGMQSVYPGGVRWERLRMGRLRRSIEQRLAGSMADAVERADNQATILFAVGVSLAGTLLGLGAAAAVALGGCVLIAMASGLHINPVTAFSIAAGAILGPMFLARLVEHRFGERLSEDRRPRRMLAAVLRFYGRLGLGRGSHTIVLLTSHGGERRVNLMIVVVVLVTMLFVLASTIAQQNERLLGSYRLFPVAGVMPSQTIDPAHYDDQRDPVRDAPEPYVQSVMVSGPWLKLVVPYWPSRDAPAIRRECAPAATARDEAARARALLDCLGRLHAWSLDGRKPESPGYALASDPRTDRPALEAMIELRGLAPGRHELRVKATRRAGHADDPDSFVIPFWI